ncbi:MAG TPA: LacI family transcriptional regulator [Candidatus Mediterraneibacter surreyensis]|nr:LacI family transcriptional regulator [Candidatus Mediterraneibacter surreyensis]
MKKTTIKDIAHKAGVSATTISRYLNGRYGYMSEETRSKIENIIKETGYRPNNVARSLRSNASQIIGIIISDIRNQFFTAILDSINREAIKTDYSLSITVSNNSPTVETALIHKLIDNGIDGLLINTVGENEDLIEEISHSIPVVLLDRNIKNSLLPVITSNNEELMKDVLIHLQSQGYDNVILLTEQPRTSSVRQIRINAFKTIANELRLQNKVVIIDLNKFENTLASPLNIEELISNEFNTAIITINGKILDFVLSASMQSNYQFGKDFGLVSFDDYLLNSLMGITTAKQDTEEIGYRAFHLLKNQIESDESNIVIDKKEIIIPGQLIVRTTT